MDSILITINQQKTKFLDRIVAGPNEKVEDEQEHIQTKYQNKTHQKMWNHHP